MMRTIVSCLVVAFLLCSCRTMRPQKEDRVEQPSEASRHAFGYRQGYSWGVKGRRGWLNLVPYDSVMQEGFRNGQADGLKEFERQRSIQQDSSSVRDDRAAQE